MFHIDIPPLRERPGDILPLARYFLDRYARETGKEIRGLSPELESFFMGRPFPGNIRELKNHIASAVLRETGKTLTLGSLGLSAINESDSGQGSETGSSQGRPSETWNESELPMDQSLWQLARVEQAHILKVLEKTGNNRTQASKLLGIGRKTLLRKLKSYGF